MQQTLSIASGYVDPQHGGVWCTIDRQESTNGGFPVYSRVFYCPVCREVWGSLLSSEDPIAFLVIVSCYRCNWTMKGLGIYPSNCGDLGKGMVPGSILDYNITTDGIDWGLLEALPPELIRREFAMTLEAILHAQP